MHGIQPKENLVSVRVKNPFNNEPGANGLLVKSWAFNGNGTNPDAMTNKVFPYWNIPRDQVNGNPVKTDPKRKQDTYDFQFEEVKKEDGIAGQNTRNPAAFFNDHFVAHINGVYYDPSYFKTYKDLKEMEEKIVAGFTFTYKSKLTTTINIAIRKPAEKLDDLDPTKTTY